MVIQHNIMAMNAYRNYNNNSSALAGNLEKLSSGYKINRAGDDAAGLAISEKMRAQITGLEAAQKNVKDGISLVKTAEGAMQEIQDMLNRMDYLATQSANGTYQDEVDREALQDEVNQLRDEINRIADSANFNGIKLLDGSLDAVTGTTSVTVAGNVTSKSSEGEAGVFAMDDAIAAGTGGAVGGTMQFTVALNDGTSKTVKFTLQNDDAATPALKNLVAEDGTVYKLANAGAPSQNELTDAVLAELNKTSLSDQYSMTAASGKITFTAKEAGTSTPAVVGVDIQADYGATGNTHTTHTKINVEQTTVARDAGREIDADSLTLYDGTNYDDAVFTINGKKFVVTTGTLTGPASGAGNATNGLGSDVTILISDGTNMGLKKADANFDQNIAKIAEVTGLNVTDAVTGETNDNGIDAGNGIRLTPGKGSGGLVLQIGDTADSFNQLRVSVGDMHSKALGIDGVDIGTQAGAQSAIDTIKNAINQVSSVRGTLGAYQNRLEHTANNLSVMAENIQDAESTIRDTDVAEEMMSYVKNNILVQSAQAMLAQANQVPQGVLQLLG